MRLIPIVIVPLIALSGCTTPQTIMKNDKTGEIVTCGGHNARSLMLGVPGYYSQKSDDAECVSNHLENGFKRIKAEQE